MPDVADLLKIEFISSDRVIQLANVSADMHATQSLPKLAMIATTDLHFGLGRMYQSYREMTPNGTKVVGIFRTREAAMEWLRAGSGEGGRF